MLEKGKISAFQMGVMMYPTIIATAILSLPATMATYAHNDLWLSPIWASFAGFLTVYVSHRLHQYYPQQTLIEYSCQIVGLIPGKLIGLLYCFLYLMWTGQIVRNYAEFVVGAFLFNTPIVVVIASMILVCVFAVRGGIEVIGRAALLFMPLFVLPLCLMVLLLLPDLDWQNFFPVLENGIVPSLKGAVVPHIWLGEFWLTAFLFPLLADSSKGRKWGMLSVLAVTITMIATNLFSLFLFGSDVSSMLYPLMIASRYVSIADFFENLESVVMAVWVLGAFVKISVFFYVIVLGSAQLMEVTDYRPLVWPIGFLIVLFSFWGIPNMIVFNYLDETSLPYYSFFMQILLPLLLLLIAKLRNKPQRMKSAA